MSASKFLIKTLLKQPRRTKKAAGFTLLELLVAMLLTFLIITPLMSLVISLMTSDRQEQAKVSSQQEIQAALDYIAQDLQQAVYVYDATGLSAAPNGIKNEIPPTSAAPGCSDPANCVPVLAFWKRKFLSKDDTIPNDGRKIGDLLDNSPGSDKFVYSLVVYYLIKDAAGSSSTWSQVSRIGRFEVSDGIVDPNNTADPPTDFVLNPDPGFARLPKPTPTGGIQARMNSWKKGSAAYTNNVVTLVDYIDDTPFADLVAAGATQFTPPNNDLGLFSTECSTKSTGNDKDGNPVSSRVPADLTAAPANAGSFYACVNPANTQQQSVVQVFLRGNALPRLSKDKTTWKVGPGNQQNQLANRPLANVRVAVRGLISPEPDPTN